MPYVPGGPLPEAVLWDMDGTLVDSEPSWLKAHLRLLAEYGVSWSTEQAWSLAGVSMDATVEILQGEGVPLSRDEIVERLTADVVSDLRNEVNWRPGAIDLILALREVGVLQGMVTGSPRPIAALVADALPAGAITAVVSGDEVTRQKPHPEPYLRAAAALGVRIEKCVAIEDTPTGLAAAIASGAATVGIPIDTPLVESAGWVRFASLTEVSPATLGTVMGRLGKGRSQQRRQ